MMTTTGPVACSAIDDAGALGLRCPTGSHLCKGKLLVMDEDSAIRKVLGIRLKHLGYEPVCVAEGTEAISAFESAYEMGQPFTGVILDLHNRIGLGGKDTLLKLLEIDPQVKAIVSSTDTYHPVMVHYQSYGFTASLDKPFGAESLQQILQGLA